MNQHFYIESQQNGAIEFFEESDGKIYRKIIYNIKVNMTTM